MGSRFISQPPPQRLKPPQNWQSLSERRKRCATQKPRTQKQHTQKQRTQNLPTREQRTQSRVFQRTGSFLHLGFRQEGAHFKNRDSREDSQEQEHGGEEQ